MQNPDSSPDAAPPSFARTFLPSTLFLFILPAFAWWFAGHAARTYDEDVYEAVEPSILSDASIPPAERDAVLAQWRHLSELCAAGLADDPGASPDLRDACGDYGQFEMAADGAIVSILLGVLSLLVVAFSSVLAYRNAGLLHPMFALGWHVLRIVTTGIIVIQGALLVWLSFWMTALWFEVYFVKLILVAGVLALLGVGVVVKAIFKKVGQPLVLTGDVLSESDTPSLWAHVRDICQRVEVTPPDHIVAGIDTNFFVTEAPLITTGGDLDGRTLYVSLSLLKALEHDEASAVLSHEMAHFHGDTEVSSKLAPLLDHFALYLRDLMDSPLTLPVFYLMRLHRAAMELAIAKHSRDREFVADATAARVVSPEAIGRALVRIGAYARFRDRIERELFDQDAEHDQIAIGARLTSGFVAYGATPEIEEDLDNVFQPHPFDSHPPLDERLAAIARPMDKREKRELIATAPARTLFADIEGAEEREAELWAAYEDRFAQAHAHDLAYRYYPATPEEEAHVLRFFPEQRFELKKGGEVVVSYASLDTPMWGNAIEYDEVKTLRIMETNGDPVSVELHLHRGSKQTLALGKLRNKHEFLAVFNEYWVRHNVAREEKKRRDAEAPKAAS